jgi:sugar/nucleoside kinase (ribokinase family)
MTPYDILVVGDYCLDFIFTGLNEMPSLGHEITSTGFLQTPGGACNSVLALHRLGLKVGWLTNFGNDDYSKFILDCVRQEGLPEEFFLLHDQPLRKVTVSLSYPHERAFIAYYDPNPLLISEVKNLPRAQGKALYVPGFYLGCEIDFAVPLLKRRKIKLAMDGNTSKIHRVQEKRVGKLLKSLDLFLCNAKEARILTGETDLEEAIKTLGKFCPEVVIKNGGEGALGWKQGNVFSSPSIKVKVKDTTGAGDCFSAGFLKKWLDGSDFQTALDWGNIVGGLSTTEAGGIGRVIHSAEVEEIYRKGHFRKS